MAQKHSAQLAWTEFRRFLVQLRKEHKIYLQEMADRLDMREAQLRAIESGISVTHLDFANSLCKEFNLGNKLEIERLIYLHNLDTAEYRANRNAASLKRYRKANPVVHSDVGVPKEWKPSNSFGTMCAKLRRRTGDSIDTMRTKLNIGVKQLWYFETGQAYIPETVFEALCKHYKIHHKDIEKLVNAISENNVRYMRLSTDSQKRECGRRFLYE